ncbi:MAG: multicopper oxidase domain-containing protein [Nitrososphaeraceae archaeon]|nr:multicopper oxidase domain-containing protein [Nitrososphaeraceae archaeon]
MKKNGMVIVVAIFIISVILIFNGYQDSLGISNVEKLKKITLVTSEKVLEIAPSNTLHTGGIFYQALTYNGTIPGPTIELNQGDVLNFTLKNADDIVHSIDFHGIGKPSEAISGSIKPGESKNWQIKAENPGVFVYHCDGDNLNGIWEHISSGMFGSLIIHPKKEVPAKEFFISFNEIYNDSDPGLFKENNGTVGSFDMDKFMQNQPDLILTNGIAFKYFPVMGTITKIPLNDQAELFNVKTGELTRWYIINAGPRNEITFNFAGGMIDNIDTGFKENNNSTMNRVYEVTIPPGGGKIIETIFAEEGIYFGNDHDIGTLLKGAGFVVKSENN